MAGSCQLESWGGGGFPAGASSRCLGTCSKVRCGGSYPATFFVGPQHSSWVPHFSLSNRRRLASLTPVPPPGSGPADWMGPHPHGLLLHPPFLFQSLALGPLVSSGLAPPSAPLG